MVQSHFLDGELCLGIHIEWIIDYPKVSHPQYPNSNPRIYNLSKPGALIAPHHRQSFCWVMVSIRVMASVRVRVRARDKVRVRVRVRAMVRVRVLEC